MDQRTNEVRERCREPLLLCAGEVRAGEVCAGEVCADEGPPRDSEDARLHSLASMGEHARVRRTEPGARWRELGRA